MKTARKKKKQEIYKQKTKRTKQTREPEGRRKKNEK